MYTVSQKRPRFYCFLLKLTIRFSKVKWLHLTGEVDKCVGFHVKFSQNLTYRKLLKSVNFLTELFKKGGRFLGHSVNSYSYA